MKTEDDEIKRELFTVEPLVIEEHYTRLPGEMARANELYAQKLRAFLRAKRNESRTYARRFLQIKAESEVKMTEAERKFRVETDKEYETAVMLRIDAEVERARYFGYLEALRAKKDSIISLGAQLRAEMGGAPKIRDAQRDVAESRWNTEEDE